MRPSGRLPEPGTATRSALTQVARAPAALPAAPVQVAHCPHPVLVARHGVLTRVLRAVAQLSCRALTELRPDRLPRRSLFRRAETFLVSGRLVVSLLCKEAEQRAGSLLGTRPCGPCHSLQVYLHTGEIEPSLILLPEPALA